jgi:hypothetical protein
MSEAPARVRKVRSRPAPCTARPCPDPASGELLLDDVLRSARALGYYIIEPCGEAPAGWVVLALGHLETLEEVGMVVRATVRHTPVLRPPVRYEIAFEIRSGLAGLEFSTTSFLWPTRHRFTEIVLAPPAPVTAPAAAADPPSDPPPPAPPPAAPRRPAPPPAPPPP